MNDLTTLTTYQERLVSICDRITDFFDWDMERELKSWEDTGSRSINMTEDLRKTVYKAKMESGLSYGLGITALYERIETPDRWGVGWSDLFGYKNIGDFTLERIESQRTLGYIIVDLIELYRDWKANEFDVMVSGISDTLDSEDEFKVSPAVLEAINKLVLDGTFKAYKYRDNGDTIGVQDKYHLSTVIGFSEDLTMWLNHIQNQDDFLSKQDDDTVFVTMFGKLDEVAPIYSNWLFTLHKGKSIWIVTDQVEFDNPYQKKGRLERRSALRDRYATYDTCDLPYNLFENIDVLRGERNKLAKNSAVIREDFVNFKDVLDKEFDSYFYRRDNTYKVSEFMEKLFEKKLDTLSIEYDFVHCEMTDDYYVDRMYARKNGRTVAYAHTGEIIIYRHAEIFFQNMSELNSGQKMFAVLLVKEMIQYLGSEVKLEQIMLAGEHIEMKLLEGGTISPNDPKHLSYWTPELRGMFNELLETVDEGEKSTAVAVRTYDVVRKSKSFNASWLTTPDKHESLSEWSIVEDEKDKLWNKVYSLSSLEDEAFEWLDKQIVDNYETLVKRMTIAKQVQFYTQGAGNGFTSKMRHVKGGSIFEMNAKGKYSKKGHGIGKTEYREEDCLECRKFKNVANTSKIVKRFNFGHYKELMWFLDIDDRNKLPKYFRQYRGYNMIPYSGNSLLDQTHPFLRLHDPCSRKHSNSISIDMFMCGTCYKKIKQEETLEIKYTNVEV